MKLANEWGDLPPDQLPQFCYDLEPTGDDSTPQPSATAAATGDTMIVLPSGDVSITEAATKIFGLIARGQRLFYRGGTVCEIVKSGVGTVSFSLLKPAQFRSRLEQYGRLFAWRSGNRGELMLKPCICPEETAKALLESQPARECLPNVELLSRCPVLANINGEPQVLGTGWHSYEGGVYVVGGDTPPDVSLADAVRSLEDLLAEFDFAAPGDRSRALASLVSPAMYFGSWLRGPAPIDIGEADASQSGKTYRQKVVAAIYGEVPNLVVQRSGGVGSLDESISQKLIDGRPFILIDNVRGRLDSPFLEATLTAPGSTPARVPHKGEIQVDARRFMFQMTSNGAETTSDLVNRASIIRIRKRPSEFLFKAYPEGELWDHVTANQPHYLGCAYTIVKEWVRAGCPRTVESRHTFRQWAQSLDWIVQKIFRAAPLLDGQMEAGTRISNPSLTWLREMILLMRDSGNRSEVNASMLAEICMEHDKLPPGAKQDADKMTVARSIGKAMATVFKESNHAESDGFKVYRIYRFSPAAGKDVPWYQFGGDPPTVPAPNRPAWQSQPEETVTDLF